MSAREVSQSEDIWDGVVGQGIHFQIAPEIFHRVEFRGVGRKEISVEVRSRLYPILYLCRTMRGESIPDENQGFLQFSLQVLQEGQDQCRREIRIRVKTKVQPDIITRWRNRERRDGRNLAPGIRTLIKKRCLTLRSPGPPHQRGHH